ncbi:MAG TPA: protein phosphatase 2C domain-containing protein [Casimicrobiaceae bacterium]
MSLPTPCDIGARAAATARQSALATRWARLEAAAATATGMHHGVNEDSHSALDAAVPLYVVADGVGGGAHASRASRELVARLHEALAGNDIDVDNVRLALFEADRAIERSIAACGERTGAATVALCKGLGTSLSRWLVAWVGDCRVYRLGASRDGAAQLLTIDDTYRHLDELPPRGGSLDDPARMIGNGAIDAPNVRWTGLRSHEMLLLCSDGVHRHAGVSDIARVLRGPGTLARRCMALVELARARGSHDDATVLAVHRVARPHWGAEA